MKRRSLFRLGAVVWSAAAGASVLAGCSNNPSASEEIGFAQGDGSFTRIPPDKRVKAAVLTGKDLAGKPLTTGGREGRVIVLNVWGSWCGPCRKEAPELVSAAAKLKATTDIIGINTRDNSADTAAAFVRSFKIPYPNFYDPDGALLLELSALPPKAIPSTLVIDAQGRIAARVLGEVTSSTLVSIVNDVVAGK